MAERPKYQIKGDTLGELLFKLAKLTYAEKDFGEWQPDIHTASIICGGCVDFHWRETCSSWTILDTRGNCYVNR